MCVRATSSAATMAGATLYRKRGDASTLLLSAGSDKARDTAAVKESRNPRAPDACVVRVLCSWRAASEDHSASFSEVDSYVCSRVMAMADWKPPQAARRAWAEWR